MLETLPRAVPKLRLAFYFAIQSVRNQARRIVLSVFGVAIGIGAVMAMLTIGRSVAAQATRSLARLNGDVMTVAIPVVNNIPGSPPGMSSPPVAPDQSRQFELIGATLQTMPEVQHVTSVSELTSCNMAMSDAIQSLDILAGTPKLQNVLSLTVHNGRFLNALDKNERWVVLGSNALQELRKVAPSTRLGSTLELCGKQFTIVGTLSPYFGDDLLPSFKINQALIVNQGATRHLTEQPPEMSYLVRLRPGVVRADMADQLEIRLRHVLGLSVKVSGARQLAELKQQQVSLYTRFLAVLGGVSLLVGSLGITNVMLVSVSERKAEIGLRMALGATALDITLQFLMESVLICLCGAALGLLLGAGGAWIALSAAQIEFSINIDSPLIAAFLSVIAGFLSGGYPAARAAKLDPVIALQG